MDKKERSLSALDFLRSRLRSFPAARVQKLFRSDQKECICYKKYATIKKEENRPLVCRAEFRKFLIASFAVFMVPDPAEWFILRLVDLRFLLWDHVCMKEQENLFV